MRRNVLLLLITLLSLPAVADPPFFAGEFHRPAWAGLPKEQREALTAPVDAWVVEANQIADSAANRSRVDNERLTRILLAAPVPGSGRRADSQARLLARLGREQIEELLAAGPQMTKSIPESELKTAIHEELAARTSGEDRALHLYEAMEEELVLEFRHKRATERVNEFLSSSDATEGLVRSQAESLRRVIAGSPRDSEDFHLCENLVARAHLQGNEALAWRIVNTVLDQATEEELALLNIDSVPERGNGDLLAFLRLVGEIGRLAGKASKVDWAITQAEARVGQLSDGEYSALMGGLLVNRGLCESIRGGYENAERYLVLALQEKLEPDYIGACYYYLAEGAIRLHDKDSAVGYLIEGSALPRNAYTGRLEALLVFLENNQD